MTSNRYSVSRNALGLLSFRWVVAQIVLGLLVCALSGAWLRIPDASAVDIVGTVLLGLIVLTLAGGGEAALLLWLSRRPIRPARVILGGLLILFGITLWFGWSSLLRHFAENDMLWAGYWNSRFSAGLRNVFSYPHMLLWFSWFWNLLEWIGDGVLVAVVAASIAGSRPIRAMVGTLRTIVYWTSLIVGLFILGAVSGWLTSWTPGHGLAVETVSLLLRLAALILFDGILVSLIIAVVVACINRYEIPAGTPDESQPRTEAIP